jgi:hypothetical protein
MRTFSSKGHMPPVYPGTVPRSQVVMFIITGMAVGLCLGYVLMGTAHAFFEIGAAQGTHNQGSIQSTPSVTQHTYTPDLPTKITPLGNTAKVSSKGPANRIHTIHTSNGSPYQNFQSRIMFGTYKLVQALPGACRHVKNADWKMPVYQPACALTGIRRY